jgi:hypothetical protein
VQGLACKIMGLAAAITVACAAQASAGTFEPTRPDDPIPDGCTANDCSLREAARDAVLSFNDDRILLDAATYEFDIPDNGDGDGLSGDLDLFNSGTIEIVGRGPNKTTIDARGVDRIVEIFAPGPRVEISRLTLQGGAPAGVVQAGGAISNEGRLTLRKVVVQDNSALEEGGGLQNELGAVTKVISSTFFDNHSTGEFGRGGAINNRNEAKITLTNSEILENSAGTGGGGITNQNEGRMTLRRVTVAKNFLDHPDFSQGGGIFNQNDAKLTVTDSTIWDNTSPATGGGMFIQNNAVASFKNSTLTANQADTGGAISTNNYPTLKFAFTTIGPNLATSSGGAIFDGTDEPGPANPQPPFFTFRSSIVGASSAPLSPTCFVDQPGAWKSKGFNVEDGADSCLFTRSSDRPNADAGLGLLAGNGGPTMTHELDASSDAVDAAPKKGCPKRDQRGVKRPQGPRCDSGSYERR